MTIQECYQQLEGNYEEMIERLHKEAMVQRFALKFINDSSFCELSECLKNGNVQDAFRSAHTLKGVCANLSFTKLLSSASEITELLRDGKLKEAVDFFNTVSADYNMTITALENFKATK